MPRVCIGVAGMYFAIIHLFSEKVILFLTDGQPTDSEDTIAAALRKGNEALNNQVILLTFGLGHSKSLQLSV